MPRREPGGRPGEEEEGRQESPGGTAGTAQQARSSADTSQPPLGVFGAANISAQPDGVPCTHHGVGMMEEQSPKQNVPHLQGCCCKSSVLPPKQRAG